MGEVLASADPHAEHRIDANVPPDGSSPEDLLLTRLPVAQRVTTDLDAYTNAVAGVQLDMVRGGPDEQPSRARSVRSDLGVAVSAVEPGCRTISHTCLDRDRLASSYVIDAAPGTLWCGEIEVTAGMRLVHHPDAEHTAVNLPGTRFAFAIVDVDAVVERSEVLEVPLLPWRPGNVEVVGRPGGAAAAILSHIGSHPIESVPCRLLDELITSIALDRCDPESDRRVLAPATVDSRKVVGDCIDLAAAIGREPAISELCLAGHVSGRRLRQAFHDVFGVPPTRFFRYWALCEAHDRLLAAAPEHTTVTRVAMDLGLTHLGRFSLQYRELHGETPSETLLR